jgi:hypothetical protein
MREVRAQGAPIALTMKRENNLRKRFRSPGWIKRVARDGPLTHDALKKPNAERLMEASTLKGKTE